MTEHRNKLLESAWLFERILASTHDVVWAMDLQGRFIYVTASVKELLGYTVDEVMKKTVFDVLGEADRLSILDRLHQAANRIEMGDRDFPIRRHRFQQKHRDGNMIWTEVITDFVFDETGEFQFILGATRDITLLVREEEDSRILIESLQRSLREVRALRGFLPVCSSCRKVRATDGKWLHIEEYLHRFRPIAMSHGLCEECLRNLYPDIAEDIIKQRGGIGEKGK